jgi:hypothetical protein
LHEDGPFEIPSLASKAEHSLVSDYVRTFLTYFNWIADSAPKQNNLKLPKGHLQLIAISPPAYDNA